MDPACIACRSELLREGEYRHRVFPGIGAVILLHRYLLRHLVKLVCHIAITGRPFHEVVISVVNCGEEPVVEGLNHLESGYIQFSFWFWDVPPSFATSHHLNPWRQFGCLFF